MKAFTYDRYGGPDVLRLADVDDPVAGDGEVLIRVRAASVNPRDWHMLRGDPRIIRLKFGLRAPRTWGLGSDVSGVVEAVGPGVARFAPGDEVIADVLSGGFAELVAVEEGLVASKPGTVSFEEAAAVPLAAVTAWQGLRESALRSGQRVLIIGASGGVGTFAVQLARELGATVTGVCSTGNIELVRSLGADAVIDHTREDVLAPGRTYDVVFQLGGTASPRACRRALERDGTLLVSSGDSRGHWIGPVGRVAKAVLLSPLVSQRLLAFEATRSGEDLQTVSDLVDAGKVVAVVDRSYPLAEVPDAIRHIETGHTRGKVVITL
jgi:NADPH:quinone reductase-like Zn-dependent oxidoreductase